MKILEGIRVLDWTVLQQGSICSTLLGDLGADVIKIETPGTGDMGRLYDNFFGIQGDLPQGSTYYFEICNRNKRGMTLNLKSEEGKKIFYELVKTSDVFVQNFRVGVAEKLGLDYETLRKINPRLVYTYATGMGTKGKDALSPLIDPGALARSGLMWSLGEFEESDPVPAQGALCDQSGAIFAAYGTLAALLMRERTGTGQMVEASLFGGAIALNWVNTSMAGWSGQNLPRMSWRHPSTALSNYYCCKDGKWLMLGSYMEKYFIPFYTLAGRPDIPQDPRFSAPKDRAQHVEELVQLTAEIFLQKDRDEWLTLLRAADMICEPVRHTSELMHDQQAFDNGYLRHYHHPRFDRDIIAVGSPVQFSESVTEICRPAPLLGEHTAEILKDLGYSEADIQKFEDEHII